MGYKSFEEMPLWREVHGLAEKGKEIHGPTKMLSPSYTSTQFSKRKPGMRSK